MCVCREGGSLSLGHIWVIVCSTPQLIWLYSISERLGWPTQPSRFNTSSPRNQSWLSSVKHSVIALSVRNWPGRLLFTTLRFPLSVTAQSPLPFLVLHGPDQHPATPQSCLLTNFIESTPSCCHVPPSWDPQHHPAMPHPSRVCTSTELCWILVTKVATGSALWGASFGSLDTFLSRAMLRQFPDPPLSEPQSHPKSLGLNYEMCHRTAGPSLVKDYVYQYLKNQTHVSSLTLHKGFVRS